MQNDVTISLKAAEEVIFETARTYGGPLPNGLVNSITLALSKLPAVEDAKDAEIAALQATVARLRKNISHCQGRFLNINIALSSGGTKAEAIRIADVGEDSCKGYLTYETPKAFPR